MLTLSRGVRTEVMSVIDEMPEAALGLPRRPSSDDTSVVRMSVALARPPVNADPSIPEEPVLPPDEPVPVLDEPVPVLEEPVPVLDDPVLPVLEEPVLPVLEEPVPVLVEPDPVLEVPVPVLEEPIPVLDSPVAPSGRIIRCRNNF